ncbi:hypothetical protein AALA83_07135 [Oscillospiraceae bacterium 44-5]
MNKELFQSMQKQMTPSPEARAELSEKLAQPVKKRPVPWKKYTALAACAALVIGAFSLHSYGQEDGQWMFFLRSFHRDVIETKLHSYVTVDDLTGFVPENATTATGGSEGSDQDMGMTPEDLTTAMLDVGYTQEEIDEYQSIGYQMTWAKWWKFVHQQENSEGDDPFNLDDLKLFSQKELYVRTGALPAPNTGDLPGGAYIGDAPSQEEALNAYEELMDRFNGVYPDWYGGAYIDSSGWLVVQLVEDKDPADKSLELQVLDWTGSDQVMFSSCKYSLAQLKELMDQLNALPGQDMKFRDVMAGWGIDEEANRIELTLTQVYDPLLVVLAELDSDDDAIYVQVGQRATADVGTEDPAVHHVMPGGVPVPDDEDLAAVEPCYVEELPGKLPKEEQRPATNVEAPAYDPDAK